MKHGLDGLARIAVLAALAGIGSAAGADYGAKVQFDFYNAGLAPQGVRGFYLYPVSVPSTNVYGLTTLDRIYRMTGTNASVTISNLVAGTYRGEFVGTYRVTTNYFVVPDTNIVLYATNLVTSGTLTAGSLVGYTQVQSDGRYQKGSVNLTNWSALATNVLSGVGGSATNLTPWTTDINGSGKSLTNAGGITATGTVSAAAFVGDGSGLTGVGAQGAITNGQTNVILAGEFTGDLIGAALSAGVATHADKALALENEIYGDTVLSLQEDIALRIADGYWFAGNGYGLTNLQGQQIIAGTLNSNKLDTATAAQLALAGTGSSAQSGTNIGDVYLSPGGYITYRGTNYDYSGTTETAGIQEAINLLPLGSDRQTPGGGRVILAPGTYETAATITTPNTTNPFTLVLDGPGICAGGILYTGQSPASVLNFGATTGGEENTIVTVRNMYLSSLTNATTNLVNFTAGGCGGAVFDTCWLGWWLAMTNGAGNGTYGLWPSLRHYDGSILNLVGIEGSTSDVLLVNNCHLSYLAAGLLTGSDHLSFSDNVFFDCGRRATYPTNAWPASTLQSIGGAVILRERPGAPFASNQAHDFRNNTFIGMNLSPCYVSALEKGFALTHVSHNDHMGENEDNVPIVALVKDHYDQIPYWVFVDPTIGTPGGAKPYKAYSVTNHTDFTSWNNTEVGAPYVSIWSYKSNTINGNLQVKGSLVVTGANYIALSNGTARVLMTNGTITTSGTIYPNAVDTANIFLGVSLYAPSIRARSTGYKILFQETFPPNAIWSTIDSNKSYFPALLATNGITSYTNSVFGSGTNIFIIGTNAYPGIETLYMPSYGAIMWPEQAMIRGWADHGNGHPLINLSGGDIALSTMQDGGLQLGTSGCDHDEVYLQYDDSPSGAAYTNGTSKRLGFVARNYYGSAVPTIVGICESTNTITRPNSSVRGLGQLVFYTVPPYYTNYTGGAKAYDGIEVGRMLTNGWKLAGRLVQSLGDTAYTYGGTVTIDFNGGYAQQLSVSGATTLQTTNSLAGQYERHLIVITAAADSTIACPTNWIWNGSALTNITNGGACRLELESIGASEANIIARADQLTVPPVLFEWDADASNFLALASIGFTNATATNVNDLVIAAKSHGWWTNCDGIYPMVGDDLTNTVYNLRTNSWHITWNSAAMSSTGVVLALPANHGDVAFNASSSASIGNFGTNSVHLFAYVENMIGSSNQYPIAFASATYYCDLWWTSSVGFRTYGLNETGGTTPANNPGDRRGPVLVSKVSASSESLYAGGTTNTVNPGSPTLGRPNSTLAIGAGNASGGAPMNGTLAGASFGGAIPSDMATLMFADWENFNTAMGRQVP